MIGAIENFMIDRISDLSESGALGYRLRQVKTYSGELRGEYRKNGIRDLPAVWLAFDKATPLQQMNGYIKLKGSWVLLLATESLRNEQASRHGSAGEVGAYQIAIDLIGSFANRKPDVEGAEKIHDMSIVPVSVDERGNGRLAVYGVPFSCDFKVDLKTPDVPEAGPGAYRLETVHSNWDLPPIGGMGETLPDDENADANSTVTGD